MKPIVARTTVIQGTAIARANSAPACSNDVYEQRTEQAFASEPLAGIDTIAYGDLFLEDVRAYREQRLAAAGRRGLFPIFDQRLLTDLSAAVDPCGENGEFHTFVHAGPILRTSINCTRGDIADRGGFVFCDLTPK
jgi:hypothetical protein